MSTGARVAVVVPTRDRPGLLAAAVRSVLGQTYRQFTVLVVDDGSRPAARLPPDVASDPRVRMLRLERSVGAGAARNAGVAESSGELVAFLDDDDTWRPTKLERSVEALDAAPSDVAASECGWVLRDDRGVRWRYVPPLRRDLRTALLWNPALLPSTVTVHRSALEALGGFDATMPRCQDWELWIRFADRFDVAAVPEVLVDRTWSATPAHLVLEGTRQVWDRAQHRIAALPPKERARFEAHRLMVEAALHNEMGRTGLARRQLLRAWRYNPSGFRPLLHLGRTVVGEEAWQRLARVLRARRLREPDPPVSG